VSDDREFRVRPGKARRSNGQVRAVGGLVAEVLRVAARSSGTRRPGWCGNRRSGQSSFGRGRTAFARSRLFGSGRRALVKMVPVRHRGGGRRMAPLSAHIAYLKRDGVTRDGSPTQMFDADGDRADTSAFADRCRDDRHHFRIIVSPEDAADLSDLRDYTRDLVRQMEADLDTRLEWVAVDHWNTDNPHVHLLVRGVTDQGRISSSPATISATACVRAPRNWHSPSWGRSPSMRSSARWNEKWRPNAGPGSMPKSGDPPTTWA
jgi:hypothetical protein